MTSRLWVWLALAGTGCNAGGVPLPVEAPRPTQLCAATGRKPALVVEGRRAEISSLVVVGDEVFYANSDRFIPVDYVTEGVVARTARCGGMASPASEVHDAPSYLVANGVLVQWIAHGHNAVGENLGGQVWSLDVRAGEPRKAPSARNVDVYRLVVTEGAVFALATSPPSSGTTIYRLADDLASLLSFRASGFLLPGDRLVLFERNRVMSVDARTGEAAPIWEHAGMLKGAVVFDSHVFYTENGMLIRRALAAGAAAETLFAVDGELSGIKVDRDQVFFADKRGIQRGSIAARRTELWVERAGDWPSFMPLAVDASRLYFVTQQPARVWAIDR